MKVVRCIIFVDTVLVCWIVFLLCISKVAEEASNSRDSYNNAVEANMAAYTTPASLYQTTEKVPRKVSNDEHTDYTAFGLGTLHTPVDIPAVKEIPTPEYESIVDKYTKRKEVPTIDQVNEEVPEDHKTPAVDQYQDDVVTGGKQEAIDLDYWKDNVCDAVKDSICHEVFVLPDRKVTFCSAAKVASTTTKTYFYKLSSDLVIPENAQFGVHEANWNKFHMLDKEARKYVLTSPDWTHVFFWKHVLERFVSGYLDKVVNDCKSNDSIGPHLAIYHYVQYGFSCEDHVDLEAFIAFMETVPSFEGHFAPQAPLCSLGKYPVTDMISADETLSDRLKVLSAKLGVEHPGEDFKSKTHSTKANTKMVALFKDRPYLIQRVLDLFKVDCEKIPDSCNVEKLVTAIKEERAR
mmetsp:Transcript_20249/g.25580  ORF Transcript_20249/g.25580 Transcript_20249/m.25580 type:complete len:407 (+) Transcript_20249:85-1305(+)